MKYQFPFENNLLKYIISKGEEYDTVQGLARAKTSYYSKPIVLQTSKYLSSIKS